MGLVWLIAGLVLFAGGHLVSAARDLRGRLIAALGAMPFKIIYSIVAFAGVILMGYGFARYRSEGWIDIWMPPAGLRQGFRELDRPAGDLAQFTARLPPGLQRLTLGRAIEGTFLRDIALPGELQRR